MNGKIKELKDLGKIKVAPLDSNQLAFALGILNLMEPLKKLSERIIGNGTAETVPLTRKRGFEK